MGKKLVIILTVLTAVMLMIGLAWAAFPAPPVWQYLGLPDTVFSGMTESACRTCHNTTPNSPPGVPVDKTYLPTRHHLLVKSPPNAITIPLNTDAPCALPIDPFFTGINQCTPGTSKYECLSCHVMSYDPTKDEFTPVVVRDCTKCHQQTAGGLTVHHRTDLAQGGYCASCHGSFVASVGCISNPNPNPPIPGTDCLKYTPQAKPAYSPSIVTPWPSKKPNGDNTIPPSIPPSGSSPGVYAGNCNYCHNTKLGNPGPTPECSGPFAKNCTDADPTNDIPVQVYRNDVTHHETGFFQDNTKCAWCHNATPNPGSPTPDGMSIRTCENCHDIRSLHNIQYDATGSVSPGNEAAGNGHIGAQSDCWGCHGNNGTIDPNIGQAMSGSPTSATVPGAYTTSIQTAEAGSANPLTLTGAALLNTTPINNTLYTFQATALLTDRMSGATTEIAGTVTPTTLDVTLPSTLAPGNYKVQAKKSSVKLSNPLVVALKPAMTIASATCSSGNVTITGSNFHVYQDRANTVTGVTGLYNGATLTGKVTSWTESGVAAKFTVTTSGKRGTTTTAVCPTSVTVTNVFDSATSSVSGGSTGGGGKKNR